jgi:uncharacterized protein YqgC (DUF456 family)
VTTLERLKEFRRVRVFVIVIVLAILFFVASAVAAFWCWQKWGVTYNGPFDGVFGAVVGALIGSIVTLVLVLIGMWQVKGIAGTASADFVLRKCDQFFKNETRILLHLIDSDYLVFKKNSNFNESFFLVDEARIKESQLHSELKERLLKRRAFSAYEIDDLLLGPLEDLGYLESVGTVDLKLIDNTFGLYLIEIWENPAIRDYITANRKTEGEDLWEYAQRLYNKLQ